MVSRFLVILGFVFTLSHGIFGQADACVAKYPNMQTYEDAFFKSIAEFTSLNASDKTQPSNPDLLPVTLGPSGPDGYGNCHLYVYLGKDKHPAAVSAKDNYQTFTRLKLWSLGFTVENRATFVRIFDSQIQMSAFKGVRYADLN